MNNNYQDGKRMKRIFIESPKATQKQHKIKKVGNFQYDLHNEIGSGFSSKVYKGKNYTIGSEVAIKVIELKKITNGIERLLIGNEVKALKMIKNPNLLRLIHTMQTQNNLYLVTELFEENLETLVGKRGRFIQQEIMYFLIKITEGLCYLQSKGIIHRDIKPSNIFIKNGEYVLGDFGFCYFIDSPYQEIGYNVGSPLYMSPQAYKASTYSYQSDVWALGVCIIELILGNKPFIGMNYDQMIEDVCIKRFYRQLSISEFLKKVLDCIFIIGQEKRIGPLQLLQKLQEGGNVGNGDQIISEFVIGFKVGQRENNGNRQGNHRRSVSVRINHEDKQLGNVKNGQQQKTYRMLQDKQLNYQFEIGGDNIKCQPLLLKNRSQQNILNQQNINYDHCEGVPPQMIILQKLSKMFVSDCSYLHLQSNLLKLLKIISVIFKDKIPNQLEIQVRSLPSDGYYNNVIKTISTQNIFQISHYLIFLMESSLSQLLSKASIPQFHKQFVNNQLKILQQALNLWTHKNQNNDGNLVENCKGGWKVRSKSGGKGIEEIVSGGKILW